MKPQPHNFFDAGLSDEPAHPDASVRIVLERTVTAERERFAMRRRIGYRDREVGDIVVPGDLNDFRTDLASVPAVFTWLVPRSGKLLPAAIIHDALVDGELGKDYLADQIVLRPEADRMFRDAMGDSGTGVVRRWLAWAAVTTATMVVGRGSGWSAGERLRYRWSAIGFLALIALLGVWATFDLADTLPGWLPGLPWMGERSWGAELLGGAIAALVIPLVLGLSWGRFRAAAWIMGIGLAFLFHVTVALAALTGLYWIAERILTPLVDHRS